jgi:endonuclease/exonuclease/phosphatase (EEP) superfamily protein YafD
MLTTPSKQQVLIANIHAIHPHIALERNSFASGVFGLTASVRNREASIRALLSQLNASTAHAVLMAGDLNASMRNRVYEDIRQAGFSDTWLELQPVWRGGTWPFPGLGGIPLLAQLVRIDFLFHTPTLRAKRIELLPESLDSDHRGMIAEFEVSFSAL